HRCSNSSDMVLIQHYVIALLLVFRRHVLPLVPTECAVQHAEPPEPWSSLPRVLRDGSLRFLLHVWVLPDGNVCVHAEPNVESIQPNRGWGLHVVLEGVLLCIVLDMSSASGDELTITISWWRLRWRGIHQAWAPNRSTSCPVHELRRWWLRFSDGPGAVAAVLPPAAATAARCMPSVPISTDDVRWASSPRTTVHATTTATVRLPSNAVAVHAPTTHEHPLQRPAATCGVCGPITVLSHAAAAAVRAISVYSTSSFASNGREGAIVVWDLYAALLYDASLVLRYLRCLTLFSSIYDQKVSTYYITGEDKNRLTKKKKYRSYL
ncbi:ama1 protein, putative, partial [Bodo saltans]